MSARQHRLHSICPYFAMFPLEFARKFILNCTHPGDLVLDPFSGRGTSLLESLLLDRQALASDISPVAACVTGAKASVPDPNVLKSRVTKLEQEFKARDRAALDEERRALPRFFSKCFHYLTLREILFLRSSLRWRNSDVDRFITALMLGSLHGEADRSRSYFSNQMPRTISTKPAYSIRYWRERDLRPPRRKVFEILTQRIGFRFRDAPPTGRAWVANIDARNAGKYFSEFEGPCA